jgi:hypothetical protein
VRVGGGSGLLMWAQLLRDVGAPDEIACGLLGEPGPPELDDAAGPDRSTCTTEQCVTFSLDNHE